MNEPKIEFFDNVLKINHFCRMKGSYSTLVLENSKNGEKLYLRPVDFSEENSTYLLCFPDRSSAERFEKIEEVDDPDVEVELNELLDKYKISAFMLGIVFDKVSGGFRVSVYPFGKYRYQKLNEIFYNRIVDFLNNDDLKIKYLEEKPAENFGLPPRRLQELCLNAVALHPIFLEEGHFFDYYNPITKEAGYFLANENMRFGEKNVIATYSIFPKIYDENSYDLLDDEEFDEENAIILYIKKLGKVLKCQTSCLGETKELEPKEKDLIVKGFLEALEEIKIEAVTS